MPLSEPLTRLPTEPTPAIRHDAATVDAFLAGQNKEPMPKLAVRAAFDGEPRCQFQPSAKIGWRRAAKRQSIEERRVGTQGVCNRPFPQRHARNMTRSLSRSRKLSLATSASTAFAGKLPTLSLSTRASA